MLIPTKLLKVIDFHKEISSCNNAHIKEWLTSLNYEKQQIESNKEIFIKKYQSIKYSINSNYINYTNAHNQLIDEHKVEWFCKNELKTFKNVNKNNI
jgi:hypothetical protein